MAQMEQFHRLTLSERKKLTMTAVTEVVSFDEESVVLVTQMGTLTVHGTGLQLKELILRGDLKRCLIVSPGSLSEQWQDELYS